MPRVLAVGYFGFGNVGDDSIGLATIRTLRDRNPAVEITASSGPEPVFDGEPVRTVRFSPARIARALLEADTVVLTGGTHFHDRYPTVWNGLKAFTFYLWLAGLAKSLGRDVHLVGHGIGPLDSFPFTWMTRGVLHLADSVTVRDPASRRAIADSACDPAIGFDVAVLLDPPDSARTGETILGVSLTPAFGKLDGDPERDETLANSIAEPIIGAGGIDSVDRIRLFVCHTGTINHDRDLSATFADALDGVPTQMVPYRNDPEEFLASVAGVDYLIGMKLHSLVFAYMLGIPNLAVSYHPKCRHFREYAGYGRYTTKTSNQAITPGLDEDVERLLSEPGQYTASLDVSAARKRASAAFDDLIRG